MTDRPTHNPAASDSSPAEHAAWARDVLRRQVERLDQLAQLGLELARAIERKVEDDPVAPPAEIAPAEIAPAEIAMAFSRVARAVRMTALLQSRLIRELEPTHAAAVAQAEEREALQDPAYRHKARVEAIVLRVAQAGGNDEATIDRLVQEAAERLDDDDIYGQVLTRPVGELVALICRDLGLDPDWGRLSQEAWAKEEITSGAAGSPFADLMARGLGSPPRPPPDRSGARPLIVESRSG